ncbi:MAG: DUF721 domain-containing protein [Candidatus Magasanikbacteria bacterium]|nr:DUF721 domain-containing protein [Candidatus Magasanikbacteria bacterium]
MPLTPLADALKNKIAAQTPLKRQIEASQILEYAQKILLKMFGKEQADGTAAIFLKNRTLTISCANSAIAQEVRLRQQEIVDGINKRLGKNEVDRIRYLL